MNKVILIGRLAAEPEIRYTQAQKAVASYRLAVDRQFKKDGQPTADFIPCIAWGSNAEFCQKYLHKGMKIAVEGRINTGSYEKDGVKHFTTDVIVEHHEFCESKASGGSSGGNSYNAPSYPAPAADFTAIDDSDGELPF